MKARPDVAMKEIFNDNIDIKPGQVELTGRQPPSDNSTQKSSRLDKWFVGIGRNGMKDRVIEPMLVELEAHPVLDNAVEFLGPRQVGIGHQSGRAIEHAHPEVTLEACHQILARGEVQVDRPLRNTGCGGNLGNRCVLETVADGELRRSVEDLSSADLGALKPAA